MILVLIIMLLQLLIRNSQVFNEKEWNSIKMFRFVKQIFVSAKMFFGWNVSGVNLLNAVPKCASMNNQECKEKPEIININSNEPLFCS